MSKFKSKKIQLAVVGMIIGLMMTVVFSKSKNVIALTPAAVAIGGLIGTLIDKRKMSKEENGKNQ
ncbi:MAG: hypothetical protein RIA63_09425 [Cyclobacteriaceae bacterium]